MCRGNAVRPDSTGGTCVLEFGYAKRVDTFEGDGAVITFELTEPVADIVSQYGVCAKGVEIHVSAHGDQLRAGKIIQRNVVLENLADLNELFPRGRLTAITDLDASLEVCLK